MSCKENTILSSGFTMMTNILYAFTVKFNSYLDDNFQVELNELKCLVYIYNYYKTFQHVGNNSKTAPF